MIGRLRLWFARLIAPKGSLFNADMSLELDRLQVENEDLKRRA